MRLRPSQPCGLWPKQGKKLLAYRDIHWGLFNELTVMLEGIEKSAVNPGMIFSFTADTLARTASLKKVAAEVQALAPTNTKITSVCEQLDNLSGQLGLPSGDDYSAFLNGTATPITHTLTLLNSVVSASMEEAIDMLEKYMALIIHGETVADADIRPALEDFADALIATVLLANHATAENIFWLPGLTEAQRDYLYKAAASFLVLANGLVAQLASGQDLIANNLLGELFPVLPADMPLEERANMPAALIIGNPIAMLQEDLNNLVLNVNWGGINGVGDSII